VQTEQASQIVSEPTFKSILRISAWWLLRKSAFVLVSGRAIQALWPALHGGPSPVPIDADSATAVATEVFGRSARRMIERSMLIVRHEAIPALFLLQPLLALERDRLAQMPEMERRLFQFNLSAERPGYDAFIRRIVPIVSEIARKSVTSLGAIYMDITSIYDRRIGQVFTDYCHLKPTGSRQLAEYIVPEMIRLGRQRVTQLEAASR